MTKKLTAPHNHHTTCPHCCVTKPHFWHVGSACRHPRVSYWIVPSPDRTGGVSPNYHFTASPHGCVLKSPTRSTGSARGCPCVGSWIVPPASGYLSETTISTAPDDHFIANPHGCVSVSCNGRASRIGNNPSVGHRVVSPASTRNDIEVPYASPNDHFTSSPYGSMKISLARGTNCVCSCPGVGCWIVPPTSVGITTAAPNDHSIASPHGCVIASCRGCASNVCCNPSVSHWVVPSSSIEQQVVTTKSPSPNDHLTSRPYSTMIKSAIKRASHVGCCPGIRSWIVAPAIIFGLYTRTGTYTPTPNDHFAASPHGCVLGSCRRRAGHACRSPSITSARRSRCRNLWQPIRKLRRGHLHARCFPHAAPPLVELRDAGCGMRN